MNAIGYLRCSTDEQALEGVSLASQRERVEAYAKLRGLTLTDIIEDPGISGGKPLAERPGGKRLLEALRAKKAATVIVLKLDRAFRSCADCLLTVEKWEKALVQLHIVDLGGNSIASNTASGKFMLTILAGAAEMEKNLIRERTSAAMSHLRNHGRRISRYIPYGYEVEGENLKIKPSELSVIEEMKTFRQQGLSLRQIAKELEAKGIHPKNGGEWQANTIRMILKRTEKIAA